MTKILVTIPCITGADHCKEAIDSVINKPNVDVLLIDNGAEQSVRTLLANCISSIPESIVMVKHNPENIFVTAAWQFSIDYFLNHPEYTHLIIMNSDLILHHQWDVVLKNRWAENPDEILLPIMDERRNWDIDTSVIGATEVFSGTPGVFITMNRKQAEIINPLPNEVKVWFSDNFIYEILRGVGYKTLIPDNFHSFHYWSKTVSIIPGIPEIIEQDKIAWEAVVKPRIKEMIEKHNGTYIPYKEIL